MKKLGTFSKLIVFLLILGTSLFAQSGVGKMAGTVKDADTGEPLIGANVTLVNTNLGAAADINGEYKILNITPGTYSVKFSFVGYQDKVVNNVRIIPGVTYELNVKLKAGVDLQEVVVTDNRLFEAKATNTVKVIDSESINRLPVKGVSNLASLQAGVVKAEGSGGVDGNATLNVRGGRGGEVVYIVDGVVQNDPLFGNNNAVLSNAAIEQISFQVGGYEAKYGQAQSGIINITTKSGSPYYKIHLDGLTSSFTDDYGYNLYTGTLGGPIIPGNTNHTFFISAERGWFKDHSPSAQGINFQSIGKSMPYLPNNDQGTWKFSAKTYHNLGHGITMRLSGIYNNYVSRGFIYVYAKNNSEHNRKNVGDNLSLTSQISQNVTENSFWNVTLGYRTNSSASGDGVFFDDLEAYGDTLTNPYTPTQGNDYALRYDSLGIFAAKGRVSNGYNKNETKTFSIDGNFTAQMDKHLFEAGFGANYSIMRYYSIGPMGIAQDIRARTIHVTASDGSDSTYVLPAVSKQERYARQRPSYFGYDIFGNATDDSTGVVGAQKPTFVYGYVQDRYELEDLVINLGIRMDYFDSQARILKNPNLPYAGGTDPNNFDNGDFKIKDPELYFSPRLGLGFPVTETTVFHAQYGRFIQAPRLFDLYPRENRLYLMKQTSDFGVDNGWVSSEITTQYEIGFRQVLGDNTAALNITAFYKNTQGLVNTTVVYYQRQPGGENLRYFPHANTDFGTIKGLAFTLDIPRISYFSASVNYTYSFAEGTGSSQSSSYMSAFRNLGTDGLPKVIAPLDFDQRHTGVINLNFFIPKGEGGMLEMLSADMLISFNSGRPYTPLQTQNLLNDNSNWGDTKGYINSRYGPGSMTVDFKVEKTFAIGDNLGITPYVWVNNLFNAKNAVSVWRSTGSPETTGFLATAEGKTYAAQNGQNWVYDYEALERNPGNFGPPRLIKLGVKMNFSTK